MLKRLFIVGLIPTVALLFFLSSSSLAQTEPAETLYILPFNQGEAPETATTALFDVLVERLYTLGEQRGIQVTIVKQELTDEDAAWFAGKLYLIGEIARYNEEKGCCYTEIKLTGQAQLHLPAGVKLPIVELSDESFFNHDITSPQDALAKICSRLGEKMAEQIMAQIEAN